MRSVHALVLALLASAAALAQEEEPESPDPPPIPGATRDVAENVGKLLHTLDSLGPWEEHYGHMMNAVDTVYRRNGWTDEPDRFSLELIREVESRPPMAIQERFDVVVGMFSDRYMLDEQQESALRGVMLQESLRMFTRHSGRIMQYGMEIIQTRAAGEPFTAEQVQRWASLAQPVFLDARERMTQVAQQFGEKLDPQQRELLERDLGAANRRLDWVGQRGEAWMRGEWSPEDWGIESDPVQQAGEARAAERAAAASAGATTPGGAGKGAGPGTGSSAASGEKGVAPGNEPAGGGGADRAPRQPAGASENVPAGADPNAPGPSKPAGGSPSNRPAAEQDAWARYVQAFIDKYRLDREQSRRAWMIHDEVRPRVTLVTQRAAERISSAAPAAAEGVNRQRDAELRRLFEQMARRLDRLVTTSQRRSAADTALPDPVPGGQPASRPARGK
ncbi:MAG: hypothetical protein IPM64_02305 [Phycisphaerales bacterium]|nr:hypothetical protein [Phycisphaerales bacterium]